MMLRAGKGTAVSVISFERRKAPQPGSAPQLRIAQQAHRWRTQIRFRSPLVLSRVHWVRPELVAEVEFLTWTEDNLLRQVVYEGLREDKPAVEMRREVPRPKGSA
jgi:ATP-dependent DNA ligase